MKNNNIISLDESIDIIYRTIYQNNIQNSSNNKLPYFFLVGAGISMPEILGSTAIIEECKEIIKDMYNHDITKFDDLVKKTECYKNQMKIYSFWFEQAFPNAINRQDYLKSLIQNSKISSANLLLAQILCSKKIASSVITPNFDDKLYQALNLFGEHDVFIADNPLDNLAVNSANNQIQIAHVHGTYHFYDCCNLEEEIIKIKESTEINSVSKVLDDFFNNRAPIVIGYSGWENDVIMNRLQKRLQLPLGYEILWFCYNEESYNNLPNWLIEHDRIKFILPEIENHINDTDNFLSDEDQLGNNLTASEILRAIVSRFSIPTPEIFSNPFKYYMNTISKTISENEDIFHLDYWVNRLKCIEDNMTNADALIKNFQEATERKTITSVSDFIVDLSLEKLNQDNLNYIISYIIYPFIKDDIFNASDKDLYYLYDNILIFIENQNLFLRKIEDIRKIIDIILRKITLKLDKQNNFHLINKIISICTSYNELLDLEIRALGIKSDLLNKTEKISALKTIVTKGLTKKYDAKVVFITIAALNNLIGNNPKNKAKYFNDIKDLASLFPNNNSIQKRYFGIKLKLIKQNTFELNTVNSYIEELIKLKNIKYNSLIQEAYLYIISNTDEEVNQLFLCQESKKFTVNKDETDIKSILTSISILIIMTKIIIKSNILNAKDLCNEILSLSKRIENCLEANLFEIDTYLLLVLMSSDINEQANYYQIIISICLRYENNEIFKYELFSALDQLFKILSPEAISTLLEDNILFKKYYKEKEIYNHGVEEYLINNIDNSITLFLESQDLYNERFQNGLNFSSINLAFIKRKHNKDIIGKSVLDLLQENKYNRGNSFRCINLALCYIEGKDVQQDWVLAINEINKINHDIKNALEWWENTTLVGEDESTLVLLLLLITKKIEFNDIKLTNSEFKNRCKKLNIPKDIIVSFFLNDTSISNLIN